MQQKLFSPQKPIWWAGLLLSAGVGLLFYAATWKSIEHDSRTRFQNLARNAQYNINARLKSYTDVLRATASLFQTSDDISRTQFRRYVQGLSLQENFHAIETVNFARFVTEAQRPAFEEAMRKDASYQADGYPPFQMRPGGLRPDYSVLQYVEPILNAPEKFGVDIAERAQVAEALRQARDSGRLTASGKPVSLLARPNRVGLGLRLPVYRNDMPLTSVSERRQAYIGSVGIGFSIYHLIQRVLQEMPIREVRLSLYDGGPMQSEPNTTILDTDPLLFDSSDSIDAVPAGMALDPSDNFTTVLPIDFNGRLWKARFSTRKADLYTTFDAYFPWMAMVAGFVSAMLIYALFHALSSARSRAVKMAKGMTKELRDSQAKLQLSHQKLRRLAAHADQIKEEERKRIAREIHDDLGQNLLVLRIEADMLASRTKQRHPILHARARATLSQIDTTIKSVRQIINDLRPNVLDLGLYAAVEWQIAEFRRRTGIACELVEDESEIHLDDHCATAFFRILQESLSNISQHAKASLVRVELRLVDDMLSMRVTDNGVGTVAAGRNKVGSFGLVGIEERINILGGQFSIHSSPGAGMTVSISVPVARAATSRRPDPARLHA